MNFESLANELLLHVFEFLRTDHLIGAFYGLNSRFDSLLRAHFIVYGIDFGTLHFDDFSIICRKYLPNLIDKLPSIHLSLNEDLSLHRSFNRLDSHGFTLNQFISLKSLSLSYLLPEQIKDKVMLALPQLINLTHLTLSHCRLTKDDDKYRSIEVSFMNFIWSLPNLTHCYFDHTGRYNMNGVNFIIPTVISSSITHISISSIADQSFNLTDLSQTTPNLRHLSIRFHHPCPEKFLTSYIPSITSLNVRFIACWFNLVDLLQYVPNLYRLKVQCCTYIRGDEWEQLISNSLPKLKIFHLKMASLIGMNPMTEEDVEKILDGYRTPFWLDEHNWFARCDWNPTRSNFHIYTLPYVFDRLCISCPIIGKSTCFQQTNEQSYDSVRSLQYDIESTAWSQQSDIQLCKIEKLEVTFPVNDYFWSMIPTFDHLTSCKIISRNNSEECQRQIQLFISHTTRLLFLKFCKYRRDYSTENSLLEIRKSSLKRIDLKARNISYDEEQCIKFAHSALAMECEELHIRVKNRTSLCDLVKTMHNLRLLYVTCDDVGKTSQRYWGKQEEEEDLTKDEFVIWLHQHLSSVRTLVQIICYCFDYTLKFS